MNISLNVDEVDILSLIGRDTNLRRKASTYGGEYAGPCPYCAGRDRLLVWPHHPSGRGRFWCRGCGRYGDAIDYVRLYGNVDFQRAVEILQLMPVAAARGNVLPDAPRLTREPEPVSQPGETWQRNAAEFVQECRAHLWAPEGERALTWLVQRCLTEDTIRSAQLGYNPVERREDRLYWGLCPDRARPVWLPRGIVIPWHIEGSLWRVGIRRPVTTAQVQSGRRKYVQLSGGRNALYNADSLRPNRPALLCEGELDALTAQQCAGDLVSAVATGSTTGARRIRWLARLALASIVLVAYDADSSGDKAVHYWLDVLPYAVRWRPLWGDANAMAQDGADVRAWILAGLQV